MAKKKDRAQHQVSDRQQWVTVACDCILQGIGYGETKQILTGMGATPDQSEVAYTDARKSVAEIVQKDIDEVVTIHTALYEEIYRRFEKLQFIGGKIKAMNAKEKLLGMHRQENMIEINNDVNLTVEEETSNYDIKLLPEEKRERFIELQQLISGSV